MNTDKIPLYVWYGLKDMNWYHECEKTFVELFGRDKLELVTKLFAATSINTSLKSNLTLFRKALYEIENDLPIGRYLPNIQQQLRQIRAGNELTGRKINSFARAMSGDTEAVVVDIWLLRAFGMDRKYKRHTGVHAGKNRSGGATDSQYTKIEHWVRVEAKKRGIEPRQLSSMVWAGVRIVTNGDKQTRYTNILRSHLQTLYSHL